MRALWLFIGCVTLSWGSSTPRIVGYVNCLCGFGAGEGALISPQAAVPSPKPGSIHLCTGPKPCNCLSNPPTAVNFMEQWETNKTCPLTHYILSFLSFSGSQIKTDVGSIWKSGGGSTTDFNLNPKLLAALKAAQANGKVIMLSLGGEAGSGSFVPYWHSQGSTTAARVSGMQKDMERVIDAFQKQNGLTVGGVDVDIELGGGYMPGTDQYDSIRDLINAIPESLESGFVPQVGNGLCVPPKYGDQYMPPDVLGGQCITPASDGTSWVLARLDDDCKRKDGKPKLTYFGIQYYNAGEALCCGGNSNSTYQHYKNFAMGWDAMTAKDLEDPKNPYHQWRWWPGPWMNYSGVGADRLLLGKPGCRGCAGSDYITLSDLLGVLKAIQGKTQGVVGGVFWWDLCRLFGDSGPFCVGGECQPSWGGANIKENLNAIAAALKPTRRS